MRPLAFFISKDLKKHTRDQQFFNTILSSILPSPLSQHVWAANQEAGTLTILTDSPAWATQLRYQEHELLKQLNSNPAVQLKKIRISLSNKPAPRITENPQRKTLSTASRKSITAAAATITDPEIRKIFESIAKRQRN